VENGDLNEDDQDCTVASRDLNENEQDSEQTKTYVLCSEDRFEYYLKKYGT